MPGTPDRRPSHDRPTNLKRFLFGAAYYPEHWDRALWEDACQRSDGRSIQSARFFSAPFLAHFASETIVAADEIYDLA